MMPTATLKLLRIPFSFFLLPVYLLALSQVQSLGMTLDLTRALLVFGILHLLIYPASNGYNSYIDRDTGPIGGLRQPPMPTDSLFWLTLGMDIGGLLLGLLVSPLFALALLGYVLASRAYSSESIRLKKYPITGFLTIFCFQGFWTYLMVLAGLSPDVFARIGSDPRLLGVGLAASCLMGGAYPLTQIYQHVSDAERGDKTLSAMLGYRGTFIFCALLMSIGQVLLAFCLAAWAFWLLQLCLLPVALYFLYWAHSVWRDPSKADFDHTMRLNLLASSCLNLCFGLMALLGR